MKTIEQIAVLLIKKRIYFTYEGSFLNCKGFDMIPPFTASYHADTKNMILMDADYNELSILDIHAKLMSIKKIKVH